MKILGKVLLLLVVALLVAGVGYPLLHEGGHSLVALCAGGAVEDIRLLPTASVLCRMPTHPAGIAAVGLGGILLPPVVAAVMPHRRFWSWFVRYILLSVCLMSLVFSLVAVGCFQAGSPLPQEDVTQILRYAPQSLPYLYPVLMGTLAVVSLLWARARPLRRWVAFFRDQPPKMHRMCK